MIFQKEKNPMRILGLVSCKISLDRMAPEVMICETFPEKHYNKLADIWSFGITLIEMAQEKPPYAEMNPAKVIFKVCLISAFLPIA